MGSDTLYLYIKWAEQDDDTVLEDEYIECLLIIRRIRAGQ